MFTIWSIGLARFAHSLRPKDRPRADWRQYDTRSRLSQGRASTIRRLVQSSQGSPDYWHALRRAFSRKMVEKQFGIGDKQAKRTLTALTNRSTIKFVRKPRPGHYVLRRKAMSTARNQRGAGTRQQASKAEAPDGDAPQVMTIPFPQTSDAGP